MKSRVPPWKAVLALGGASALLSGLFLLHGHIEGARRWEDMERRVRSARPVGLCASEPLAALLKTLPGVAGYDEGWRQLQDFRTGKSPRERARADAVLAQHLPTLEALRRLARRDSGPRIADVEGRSILAFEQLAVARAVVLSEMDRYSEAAETLRDAALIFLGLAGNGNEATWPLSAVNGTLRELALLVKARTLDAEALRGLGADLEALDRGWPHPPGVDMSDVLDLGLEFVSSVDLFQDLRKPRCMCLEHVCPVWGAWRFGFSDRFMAARAFEEAHSSAELSESVRTAPWSEARRVGDGIMDRMRASRNPIVHSHVVPMLGADVHHRESLARLRMLRLAVAVRLGDPALSLEDPFGKTFGREGLRFWSAGKDGVDDGGDAEKDLVMDLRP